MDNTPITIDSQLLRACRLGDLEAVKIFINKYFGDVNAKDKGVKGRTPLMYATENGHYEIVEFLLDKGAIINAQDKDYGWTALMIALQNIRSDDDATISIKGLEPITITEGKQIILVDREYKSATMMIFERKGNQIIYSNRGKTYTLNRFNGQILEKGHAPIVILNKWFKIAKLLIERGADINIKDNNGNTAFDFTDDEEIKKLLTK